MGMLLQSSLCRPSFSPPSPCISFSFKRSLPPLLLLSLLKSEQYRLRSKNERQPLQQQSKTEPLLAAPLITLTLFPAFLSPSHLALVRPQLPAPSSLPSLPFAIIP